MLSVGALKKKLPWTGIHKMNFICIFSSCELKHKCNLAGIINSQVVVAVVNLEL